MTEFHVSSQLAGLQSSGSASLAAGIDRRGGAATPEQLETLAAQFESLLLGQILQQVKTSMFEGDGEGRGNSAPLADAIFADLTAALSKARGLGLADSLLAPLMEQMGAGPEVVEKVRQAVQDRDFTPLRGLRIVSEK